MSALVMNAKSWTILITIYDVLKNGEHAMQEQQSASGINLHDGNRFRGMTQWFSPSVLLVTARKAITTTMFSQYADRRLTQAVLDPVSDTDLVERYDLRTKIKTDADGAVWFDYVADLGDGFDSTYAIAHLISRPSLTVRAGDAETTLPRGQFLIMGGDEVYPAATHEDYKYRTEEPYRMAFPYSSAATADRPPIFFIPGNHDWYDGLALFLAKFCAGKPRNLGSWNLSVQHRSYFSIRLTDDWWVWGFDSQVDDADIDVPQEQYFKKIAETMPDKPKIILCASVPSWLKAEVSASDPAGQEEFYRALDFIAGVAKKHCKNAKFYAVLSGDTHNYNRYSASESGTQFITSGGGGAFLHPTHHLKDSLTIRWIDNEKVTHLSIKTTPDQTHVPSESESCFPRRDVSRQLALGNLKFPFLNSLFCLFLGGLYWLIAIAVGQNDSIGGMIGNPITLLITLLLFGCLWRYADIERTGIKLALGVIHSTLHVASACMLGYGFFHLNEFVGLHPGSYIYFLLFIFEMTLGGFVGGLVWGSYLCAASWLFAAHYNDAFSAMRIANYKNFLRIRIKGDEVRIYPIGLKQVPKRDGWQVNPNAQRGNQNEAVITPIEPLKPILIEGPVVIQDMTIRAVECVPTEA